MELADLVTGVGDEVPDVEIPPAAAASRIAERIRKPCVIVFPGARWPGKCFPAALFSEVMRRIRAAAPETSFILSGSGADAPKAAAVLENLPEDFPVTDMTGSSSLPELFELVRNADAVLSNDSGPMHVAALLKRPVFSFFGPTDPRKTGPWGQENRVFRADAPCAPCMNKTCPRNETICHRIDPEAVSAAVLKQILRKEENQ